MIYIIIAAVLVGLFFYLKGADKNEGDLRVVEYEDGRYHIQEFSKLTRRYSTMGYRKNTDHTHNLFTSDDYTSSYAIFDSMTIVNDVIQSYRDQQHASNRSSTPKRAIYPCKPVDTYDEQLRQLYWDRRNAEKDGDVEGELLILKQIDKIHEQIKT